MKCHICDATLEAPIFNSDHEDYEPCPTCMVVIHDTLAGWTDKASAAEDDLPEENFAYALACIGDYGCTYD